MSNMGMSAGHLPARVVMPSPVGALAVWNFRVVPRGFKEGRGPGNWVLGEGGQGLAAGGSGVEVATLKVHGGQRRVAVPSGWPEPRAPGLVCLQELKASD